jgi:hypothetical protein
MQAGETKLTCSPSMEFIGIDTKKPRTLRALWQFALSRVTEKTLLSSKQDEFHGTSNRTTKLAIF